MSEMEQVAATVPVSVPETPAPVEPTKTQQTAIDTATGYSHDEIRSRAAGSRTLVEFLAKVGYDHKAGQNTRRRLKNIIGEAEVRRLTTR